jgi:hypothetical protein
MTSKSLARQEAEMSTLTSLVISKKRKIIDKMTRQAVAQQASHGTRVGTPGQASSSRDSSSADGGQVAAQRIDDEPRHA